MNKYGIFLLTALCLGGCVNESSSAPTADAEFINQMARKTNGDVTKLSADERKRLDEITKNNTEEVLRLTSKNLLPPAPVPGK